MLTKKEAEQSADEAPDLQAGGLGDQAEHRPEQVAEFQCDADTITLVRRGETRQTVSRIDALDTVRLIAAVHIVIFHHAKPMTPALWGSAWIPFFFALSGFGAAQAQLQRFGGELPFLPLMPRRNTLCRRFAAVWPLYALALLATVLTAKFRPEPVGAACCIGRPWLQFVVELLLLQAWAPTGFTNDGSYNGVGWYVSALTCCWLLEPTFFALAAASTRSHRRLIAALFGIVAWVLIWPFAVCMATWGFATVDISGTSVLWNRVPALSYLHQYLSGTFIAFTVKRTPICAGHLCRNSMGVLVAITLVCVSWVDTARFGPWSGESFEMLYQLNVIVVSDWSPLQVQAAWFKRVGLLLPLHFTLIYALTNPKDLLSRLLAHWPWPFLGRECAYGIYILQVSVHEALAAVAHWDGRLDAVPMLIELVVLILVAACANRFVQQPCSCLIVRWFAGSDTRKETDRNNEVSRRIVTDICGRVQRDSDSSVKRIIETTETELPCTSDISAAKPATIVSHV
mmetsp:Transcript_72423/g.120719  ORF Transcript_72423/g.120719 Transcript_72423/m.120719 type:complete len:513 (+) Transcript_72423:294-1832(+)